MKKYTFLLIVINSLITHKSLSKNRDLVLQSNAYGFSYQLGLPLYTSTFQKNNPSASNKMGVFNELNFHIIRSRPLRNVDFSMGFWQHTKKSEITNSYLSNIQNNAIQAKVMDKIQGISFMLSYAILNRISHPKTVFNFGAGIEYKTKQISKYEILNQNTDTSSNVFIFENNELSKLGLRTKVELGKEFEITRDVAMRITAYYQHATHISTDASVQSNFGSIGIKCLTFFVN